MNSERTNRTPFWEWITRPQMLVGLSALLLSLCGLFISIYEASLIRQAQRASVWPYVQIAASLSPGRINLWVQNTGVGPARIQAASVTYKGETKANWSDLIRNVIGVDPDSTGFYRSMINGRVLPTNSPGESIFRVTEDNGPAARELVASLRREILEGTIDVTVCYCSVYDECWSSSLQDMLKRWRGVEAPSDSQVVDGCEAVKPSPDYS